MDKKQDRKHTLWLCPYMRGGKAQLSTSREGLGYTKVDRQNWRDDLHEGHCGFDTAFFAEHAVWTRLDPEHELNSTIVGQIY